MHLSRDAIICATKIGIIAFSIIFIKILKSLIVLQKDRMKKSFNFQFILLLVLSPILSLIEKIR